MRGATLLAVVFPLTVSLAGEAKPKPPFVGEVTGDRVYVRAGDGINYTVLTVANRGDKVKVLGQRFEWYKITVPQNCTVWVHKSLLETSPDGKEATVTRDRVNIRARPSLRSDVMGQLPRGAGLKVVDRDGEWVGVAPPPQAAAWVHAKFVKKAPEQATTAKPPAEKPKGLSSEQAQALLEAAEKAYKAELAKEPDKRDFSGVLATYQKVATECGDAAVARRAERARQRLLKIRDLHEALRAARQPLKEFERKYKKLEEEYLRRAREAKGGEER